MMQRRITDAEYAAALVAGQAAVEKEVRDRRSATC